MANTIAEKSAVQPKSPRFNRPALCFFLFFLFFYFFRKDKKETVCWIFPGDIPWIENPAFPAPFFFFQIKKNAVNWTVKPGQKRLNPVRIGYIDIKRYFRAIYLHK